jgi:hypothetical protein
LCWTDLRPPPPVPAAAPVDPLTAPLEALTAPAAPAAAPPAAPVTAPAAAPVAGVDPLTAPLAVLLAQPLAADPEAPSVPTWPCVECGGRSPLEAAACTTCGTPFGGRIARLDDAKAVRQRRMVIGIGVAAAFLALLAAITFATTPEPPPAPPATEDVVVP